MSEMVTVCEVQDEHERILVTSILNAYEIPHHAAGEHLQNLWGAGSFGTGFNVVAGPIAIRVPEAFGEQARSILRESFSKRGGESQMDSCPACGAETQRKATCPDCGLALN